jgi:FRG domain-containing protein
MNINDITSDPATSPSDLIDLEEKLNVAPSDPSWAPWAFRGQPRTFGTLAPSFQREFTSKKSAGTAQIIERTLIEAFRNHYADLQRRTPEMPIPQIIATGYDMRCLSVMQHYGVPTRLLDWTSDFWTAIYFACAGEPSADAELWYYDRRIFLEQERTQPDLASLTSPAPAYPAMPPREPELLARRGSRLIAELDPQLTPRMREQLAHHTVAADVFADHAPLIFELQSANSPPGSIGAADRFRRIVITRGCKEKALKFLDEQKNKTASSIFPDVEGLGRFLRWHLDTLKTNLLSD